MYTGGKLTDGQIVDGATITSSPILANGVQLLNCIFKAPCLIQSPVDGVVIKNFTLIGGINLIQMSMNLIFTGKNFAAKNISIDGGTMDGGQIFQGTYGTYGVTSWVYGFSAKNITRKGPSGPVFSAAMCFKRSIGNIKLIFTDTPNTGGDFGCFNFNGGDGELYGVTRTGGWGWLVRDFACSLKNEPRDSIHYNNIDLNHNEYGGIDMRSEPLTTQEIISAAPYVNPTNIRAFNNTGGNYKASKYPNNGNPGSGYSNAVVLVANVASGVEAETRNNLSFNVLTKGYQLNEQGGTNTNIGAFQNGSIAKNSNNKYFATYQLAGLVDDINCQLLPTSPAINAGFNNGLATDIDGNKRPQGSAIDIGAREFLSPVNKAPIALAGSDQTLTLPTAQAILDGSGSYDPDGKITAWSWTQLSGPNQATISNGNSAQATINALIAGSYAFNLTVTDNSGAVSNSQVKVTVNPAPKKIIKIITTQDFIKATQVQEVDYSDGTNIVTILP